MGRRPIPLAVRLTHDAVFSILRSLTRCVAALPARWVLKAGDFVGRVLYTLDTRGRRAGRQNLDLVYGDTLSRDEKRRILLRSMQGGARAMAVLLHAAPLTESRFRAWVDVPPEVEAILRTALEDERGVIVASAHLGNWEVMIGFASLFPDAGELRFLAEGTFHPVMDRFLAFLRGTDRSHTARRTGGAVGMQRHVRDGGIAGLVMDRNVRRVSGGIWAPFFGFQARTSPLAAWLALKNDAPIAPLYCLPTPDGRYRIVLEPEPSRDVRTGDFQADVLEITTRLNRLVEARIREHPESWTWLMKRFKSRPEEERGSYPAYSIWDP